MTEKDLINEIECTKIMMVENYRKPYSYVSVNSQTRLKLNVTTILNMEILIDDGFSFSVAVFVLEFEAVPTNQVI